MKESQFGFHPGRGTVDTIYVVRQVMQKAKERKIDLHFHFIDFKATFDTIWSKALWKMVQAINIDEKKNCMQKQNAQLSSMNTSQNGSGSK